MAIFSATTSSNQFISLELETRVEGQSTANNTTTLSWWLRVRKSGSSTSDTWGNCSYSANIGGNVYNGSSQVRVSPGGATELLSGAVTVAHNSEGKLTLAVSGSISGKISGSVSGSQKLDDIARASSLVYAAHPSGGDLYIGSPITLCAQSASDTFTHSLVVEYGSYSTTILSYVAGNENFTWTPPMELCAQTPNATRGQGTFRLYTWVGKGDSFVGRQDVVFTINVPDSVVPTISDIKFSEAVAGLAEQFGVFVAGKSKVKVDVSTEGAYGSTVSGCEIKIGGVTYNGASITTTTLSYGSWSVTIKVTDSRGRTTTDTSKTVMMQAYSPPSITAFEAHRCDKDGTDNPSGDYASITYNFAIASVKSKNTHSAVIEYKRTSAENWEQLTTLDGYSGNGTIISSVALTSDYQYDLRLTVEDYFTNSRMTATLPSDQVILDLLATGNGIAIGKTSEYEETLDTAWPLRIQGDYMMDFVTERGSEGAWRYCKWASGYVEMWGLFTPNMMTSNAAYIDVTYPIALTGQPTDVQATSAMAAGLANIGSIGACCRSVSATGCTVVADYASTSEWNTVSVKICGYAAPQTIEEGEM